jgi:nitrogen fixation NifU-like protein
MLSDKLLDHFTSPRNVGELAPPAVVVDVSNAACGDLLRLSVLFEVDRITDVRYLTRGCTASIAAGSALTELLWGRSREEMAKINAGSVELALGGLPPESKHAAVLCADAVKALLKRV